MQQLRPAGVARTVVARSQEAIERDLFAAVVTERYVTDTVTAKVG